jgi:putative CGCGG family rSAM target protein
MFDRSREGEVVAPRDTPNPFGSSDTGVEPRVVGMHVSHDDVEPVTDRVHKASWSANLEREQYADAQQLTVAHAQDAIDHTADGHHVNLVTHAANGHPETFLFDELDDLAVEYEYVQQCGCGGHVTRVHV